MNKETNKELTSSRRGFIKSLALIGTGIMSGQALVSCSSASGLGFGSEERYKVAVCDWMILKRQKLSAFEFANEINADGIQMDMGGLGDRVTFDSKLGDPEMQQKFLAEAKKQGVEISSIAMSGFYAQSFAERPTVPKMVQDTVDTMDAMGIKIAYLPLGVPGDLVKKPELRPAIVERLKMAGEKAHKIGGVIAVETALDAEGELELLKDVNSPGVKISYNFANAIRDGRDIPSELKKLGAENIAQIHCSNTDGELIENDPAFDMPKIKKTLDKMGWSGWLIIERSRDVDDVHNRKYNYGSNVEYMKEVFQES
ncbi:sugar phosphate isomerase/epimerase family protein [Echinicola jeungdonensis]|uniref:Sugar phosphate isomerase/epimerase family protein n=1 Tax=Echinicola jeungdonensis TaxID=709343 RepID=A0ABV5J4Z5_9BACT|nr:sugar phosphate isomerase/epimerase family protein [Echinicola jeungdonensis]MDN3669536.1 sugar phosphate isomerase/epimerase family protein [Echinicola jeungdonensis]